MTPQPLPVPVRQLHVELRELRMFAEVVRRGGFSRAAEAVHATQSTVSKAVARLEAEVGAPLLRRHRGGIELTNAGEMVYRRAQAMLVQRDLLTQDVQALTRKPRGSLRLGFSRLETSVFFGRILAEYRRRHPEVDVSVCVEADGVLVQRLLRGDIDLAGMAHPREPRIEVLELQREPLMVLLPRDHRLAGRSSLSVTDLDGLPLVLCEDKCPLNDMVLQAFDRAGVSVRTALKTSQAGLMMELVAEGLGTAFLPRALVQLRPHPRVVAVPLQGFEHHWPFTVAWSPDAALSRAARCWLALVREMYALPDELPAAA